MRYIVGYLSNNDIISSLLFFSIFSKTKCEVSYKLIKLALLRYDTEYQIKINTNTLREKDVLFIRFCIRRRFLKSSR